MTFDVERYTKFVNDCRDAGIGLPSVDEEKREHEFARQHYLRQKYEFHEGAQARIPRENWRAEGIASKRFWAGADVNASVHWFTYSEDPELHDTDALRMYGGDQFWKERAELAEQLLRDLERKRVERQIAATRVAVAGRAGARASLGITQHEPS